MRTSHKLRHRDWLRGYYCAVAVLLREAGAVTAEVRSLYEQGGDASQADPHDTEAFVEHGLLAKPAASSAQRAQEGR